MGAEGRSGITTAGYCAGVGEAEDGLDPGLKLLSLSLASLTPSLRG